MSRILCVKSVHIRSCSDPPFSRTFPHSDWIRRDTPYLSVFSANTQKCGKNADQRNSKYGYFLRSDAFSGMSRKLEKTASWKWNAKQNADCTWTESAKLRVLRALLPSCDLRALVPYVPRALRALVRYTFRIICPILPHVPHVVRVLVLHVRL